jgi:serine/threonine-protein kinase
MAKGRLPLAEALALLEEIAQALSVVHAKAVIHRDLKPSNVFLVREGAERFVKLLDFGLAKRVENADLTVKQTSDIQVVGTPAYIAPEQAQGRPVSPATDLYALGAMAFEMVTGTQVFPGPTPFHVISAHVSTPTPLASERDPTVPPALEALLNQLLAKSPADRPVSATAVKQRLATLRAELAAHPDRVRAREPQTPARTSRQLPLAIALAVVATIAVAAIAARLRSPAAPEPLMIAAPRPPSPVAVAPLPAVAPPPPVTAAPPAPVEPPPEPAVHAPVTHVPAAPTIEQLTARMDRLQRELEGSDTTNRGTGLAFLRQQRLALTHANSAGDRAGIARKLDQVQALYFK